MSADVVQLIPPRPCFACFDFERAGDRSCCVCGRPHGRRLPEHLRPAAGLNGWSEADMLGLIKPAQ